MIEFTPSQRAEIAKRCGIGEDYLYQVFTRRKVPSAELSLAIERATIGVVSRKDLRPKDYWLIWPDLPLPREVA